MKEKTNFTLCIWTISFEYELSQTKWLFIKAKRTNLLEKFSAGPFDFFCIPKLQNSSF